VISLNAPTNSRGECPETQQRQTTGQAQLMLDCRINKGDSKYWRNMPGHMRTLERWGEFAGLERHVSTIQSDDFVFWLAAEMERGKTNRQALKKATIRRGLNTIRAALNHAVQTCSDLRTYKVPRSPLTKKSEEERDRVLSDEEISKISGALAISNELADALFFFQIALITACRMAEIRRMK